MENLLTINKLGIWIILILVLLLSLFLGGIIPINVNFIIYFIISLLALIGAFIFSRFPKTGFLLLIFLEPFDKIPEEILGKFLSIDISINQILVLILGIALLIRLVNHQILYQPQTNILFYSLLGLNIAYLSNSFFQVDLVLPRNEIFAYSVLFFIIYYIIEDPFEFFNSWATIWVWLLLLVAIFGLFQYLSGRTFLPYYVGREELYTLNDANNTRRVLGFSQNTSAYPIFINIAIPVAIYKYSRAGKFYKLIIPIAILLGGLSVLLTYSRNGYIALFINIFFSILILKKQFTSYFIKFLICSIVIMVLVLILFWTSIIPPNFRLPIQNIFGRMTDYSLGSIRLSIMSMALTHLSRYPFGSPIPNFVNPHNMILDVGLHSGIFGIILFITFISNILLLALKSINSFSKNIIERFNGYEQKNVLLTLMFAFIILLIQGIFHQTLYDAKFWIVSAFLFRTSVYSINKERKILV